MLLDSARAKKSLAGFDFEKLFIEELGWNRHIAQIEAVVEQDNFTLAAVAEKCGMAVFVCNHGNGGHIPDYPIRRKIERQVAKSAHEHIIIFVNNARSKQIWQWVKCERSKPTACREHVFTAGQSGEALIQKLRALAVSFDEEECITLSEVTGRARRAFDVERITRRFYDRFKTEHAAFLKFLDGIPDEDMERWYVSVMLNRIMFIYFIQRKGFLSGDADYLKNRLAQSNNDFGKDHFYKNFLCPLFFDGFAKQKEERSEKSRKLLGDVPYLNGGIFMPHQIEQLHGKTIQIPDKAFEKLFEFFDAYQWHLDERPLRADNEINPDVLGYIFEKYINQKQMGAYYTKEDITEYISKNTIIPFIFDAAREKCKVAFEGPNSIWHLLQEDPDRYIHEAVRRGVITPDGIILPESALPEFVQKGMNAPQARMFNRDYNLGLASVLGPEGENLTLPTETWREYILRRQRCLDLLDRLGKGEIQSINDLITHNLNIRQFAQDVIDSCEGPELLVAFWKALVAITVLDPTCGSGAFLFAALNILEALYDACLARMSFSLEEWGDEGKKNHPNYYKLFSDTLKQVNEHPNHRYFVLKSIIVNNLYGVDIMEEAVEICKLRLFLKLVAQIDRADQIEPLPDIDFNIRAGNTLVGFATKESVRKSVDSVQAATLSKSYSQKKLMGQTHAQKKLMFGEKVDALKKIEEQADEVDRLFINFRKQQTKLGGIVTAVDKEALRVRLKALTDELDHFLAAEYGVDEKKKDAFEKWYKSHQPFHWFAEFYGIIKVGGFDVIVGNPPYLDLRQLKEYFLKNFVTLPTNNLYSLVIERCDFLVNGRQGYIVPISSTATEGYSELQQILLRREMWFSSFDDRPAHLFEGLDKNTLSIILLSKKQPQLSMFSSRLNRWNSEERSTLFSKLQLHKTSNSRLPGCCPRIGNDVAFSVWQKIFAEKELLNSSYAVQGTETATTFYSRKVNSFLQVLDFVPRVCDGKGRLRPPSEFKSIIFDKQSYASIVFCLLNSTLFRWFIDIVSDGSHLNRREIDYFPFVPSKASDWENKFQKLALRVSADLKQNSFERKMSYSHDTLTVQCIVPKFAKPILDEIDQVLALYYDFTDEELDFIINYDIKYRMGLNNNDGVDE